MAYTSINVAYWVLLGPVLILAWRMLTSTKLRDKVSSDTGQISDLPESFNKLWKRVKVGEKEARWVLVIFITFSVGSLSFVLIKSWEDLRKITTVFQWTFAINSLVLPLIYMLSNWDKNRILIWSCTLSVICSLSFIKYWSDFMTEQMNKKNPIDKSFVISYGGKVFESKEKDRLIYSGHKYWIFKNDSTKRVKRISTNQIVDVEEFEYLY